MACADYDMLEVVGTAVTPQTDPPGEFLVVGLENGDHGRIRIDQIQRLVVLTRPARFASHTFLSV